MLKQKTTAFFSNDKKVEIFSIRLRPDVEEGSGSKNRFQCTFHFWATPQIGRQKPRKKLITAQFKPELSCWESGFSSLYLKVHDILRISWTLF